MSSVQLPLVAMPTFFVKTVSDSPSLFTEIETHSFARSRSYFVLCPARASGSTTHPNAQPARQCYALKKAQLSPKNEIWNLLWLQFSEISRGTRKAFSTCAKLSEKLNFGKWIETAHIMIHFNKCNCILTYIYIYIYWSLICHTSLCSRLVAGTQFAITLAQYHLNFWKLIHV